MASFPQRKIIVVIVNTIIIALHAPKMKGEIVGATMCLSLWTLKEYACNIAGKTGTLEWNRPGNKRTPTLDNRIIHLRMRWAKTQIR